MRIKDGREEYLSIGDGMIFDFMVSRQEDVSLRLSRANLGLGDRSNGDQREISLSFDDPLKQRHDVCTMSIIGQLILFLIREW